MTPVKYALVGLAVMLLAGCIIREDRGGPEFDRGHGEFRGQVSGPERTAQRQTGDEQHRSNGRVQARQA